MSHDNNDNQFDVFVPKINELAQQFVDNLLKERERLAESEDYPLALQVIEDAIDRIYSTGRIPGRDLPADIYKQKPIKLAQTVYLPTRQYPKFNFKGKILGPRGNTLKRLHQETLCSIAIKGRNCMRDEDREEQLRQTGDPALNHLKKNLHVEISTVAPPAEAYARMAYALAEIRKYIIPDKNDEISQEQYRELIEMNPEYARKAPVHKSVFGKLQQLKGGLGGPPMDDHHHHHRHEEMHEPPPPPRPYSSSYSHYRPHSTYRPPASTSSFVEKTRDLRARPYQKYAPFKK